MFSAFDVSTSGLVAQRMRLNAISSNLANMSTTRNERGEPEPYTPRYVTFQTDTELTTFGGGQGVKIGSVEYSKEPPLMKHEPGHPDANAERLRGVSERRHDDRVRRRARSHAGLRSEHRRAGDHQGYGQSHAADHCVKRDLSREA